MLVNQPIDFYCLFVDGEVIQLMVDATNLNAAQFIQGNVISMSFYVDGAYENSYI